MTNTFTIEQLREAVINDYAYLCYEDGGTEEDEISLEDFKTARLTDTWDELMKETSVNCEVKTGKPGESTLEDYIETWGGESVYVDVVYIKNEDGSTTLSVD